MYILAFETSCDDTSIALFEDDTLLAMDTMSQIKIHEETGWVVPEVAAREHANNIFLVLEKVLELAYKKLEQLDYIAVTMIPGLIPSLLTWITVAKTLSKTLNIQLVEINHIEAHIFSNYLERKENDINYPLVCLTVSGWHNEIYLMDDKFSFKKVGWTQDDSAWEAFDKVAKMMWLGYPGGPIIWELAEKYKLSVIANDSEAIQKTWSFGVNGLLHSSQWQFNEWQHKIKQKLFPRSWLVKDELNFSFSWLKSSVKREIEKRTLCHTEWNEIESKYPLNIEWNSHHCLSDSSTLLGMTNKKFTLTDLDKQEIAFEFQEAVIEVLWTKIVFASKIYWVKTILLAWWVSANDRLKEYISYLLKWTDTKFIFPIKKVYSMDNAAMVGINAYYKIKNKL